jgi:NADH-quinone oxidoreductase subunit J
VSDATFLEYLVFFAAAAMILGGAVAVIAMRNPVHSALGLVLTLFGVAVQFVAQEAHFVAAVQVIVYAGAIVVLFLFVLMLLGVDQATDLSIEPIKVQRPLAAVMAVGLVALVAAERGSTSPRRPVTTTPTSVSSPRTCSATTCSPSSSPRCC